MSANYKVAICGRVNVGKSTLFNRLISAPKAIVSPVAGTTRDRNYAECTWDGTDFKLIDTGGLIPNAHTAIDNKINQQAKTAIREADLLLLVLDTKTGILPEDRLVIKAIQTFKKPIVLVANKADNTRLRQQIADFYKLNLGEPQPVSARNGSGSGDLLDTVVAKLKTLKKPNKKKNVAETTIKIAIVGQPNVGKSSLINALLGEERLIVSSTPHTTRDAQDIQISYHGQNIVFIDTAGLRRRFRKTADPFEKQSVAQSLLSLRKSDITILVTDVSKPLSWQDKNLLQEMTEAGKGIIILANKWDLIPAKDTNTIKKYTDYYASFFPFVTWAPILFTSAIDKARLPKLIPLIIEIWKDKHKTIDDNALAKLLNNAVKRHKPSRGKGTKQPYIYSLKQVDTNPPRFQVKIDYKSELHPSYLRFLENNLRYKFGFIGTPIKMQVVKTQNVFEKLQK